VRALKVVLLVGVVILGGSALYIYEAQPTWFERMRYPLRYTEIVRARAHAEGLDPALLAAVIYQESKFRRTATSASGAIGLMQITPETARGIAAQTGSVGFRVSDLTDPATNIRFGAWYLHELLRKYGDLDLALAAYNAGEGNVDRWRKEGKEIQFAETRAYVVRVERLEGIYRHAWRSELYPSPA